MDNRFIIGAVALLATSQNAFSQEPKPGAMISIIGEAIAQAIPDEASLEVGVATNSSTAHEAISLNGKAIAAVINAAKVAGLDDTDIQTSDLSLQPQYPEQSVRNNAKISSYQVINRLSVRVRNLAHLGDTIDGLIGAGANQLYGLTFEVSEMQKYTDIARKAALADARRKAELYALAAGAKVGRLISLSESSSEVGGPRPLMRANLAKSVPVQSGEIDLKVQVNAAWQLLEN